MLGPRCAGSFEDRSKSYKPGNRIHGLGKKDQFGSHTALTLQSALCHHCPPHPPSPMRYSTIRMSGAGSWSPLCLSNDASRGSNENMWANALCKLQTSKQHVIITLVNCTHKDKMNRNNRGIVPCRRFLMALCGQNNSRISRSRTEPMY